MLSFLHAPRGRSLLGAVLAVSFVPVLLAISACLDTPIGDPEQGWADPRISGVWLTGLDGELTDHEGYLWVFEPWDGRTWLVTSAGFSAEAPSSDAPPEQDPAAGAAAAVESVEPTAPASIDEEAAAAAPASLDPQEVLRLLATLAEPPATPLDVELYKAWLTSIGNRRFLVLEPKGLRNPGFTPELWIVLHVVVKGDRLEMALIGGADSGLGDATSRGEAEQIIARHLDDPDFYEEPMMFYRIPAAAYSDVASALDKGDSEL
jgi:hypothetical protein